MLYAGHEISPCRLKTINTLWLIGKSGDPEPVPESLLEIVDIIVRDGSMGSDPVVPEGDSAWFPADSDLEILTLSYVLFQSPVSILYKSPLEILYGRIHLEQQLQQSVRLLVFQTDDPLGEAWVDEKCFLTSGLASNVSDSRASLLVRP